MTPFRVDWQPAPGQTLAERDAELLDPTAYRDDTALRRAQPGHAGSPARPTSRAAAASCARVYNRAGGLEQVRLDDTVYVERIAYDAKGQRALIAYGNGVMTRYAYDPRHVPARPAAQRALHRRTASPTGRPGEPLQDFGYDYDLAGNILAIRDRTPGSGIPTTRTPCRRRSRAGRLLIGGDALDRRFTYDPIYRLRPATGRECDAPPDGAAVGRPARAAPTSPAPAPTPRPTATTRSGTCSDCDHAQRTRRVHPATSPSSPASNRLQRLRVGARPLRLHLRRQRQHALGDHLAPLRLEPRRPAGGVRAPRPPAPSPPCTPTTSTTPPAQRVKKLVRKQGGQVEVTHYVGGFEHHRWGPAANPAENNHVHVMDDQQRIALVRLGPGAPRRPRPRGRSTTSATTSAAATSSSTTPAPRTNREEYTPYGETSFGSFARKRYRFTGQERDEESGLAYHGARYLQPALGRFTSVDPAHESYPGWSPFCYALGNPLRFTDHNGMSPSDAEKKAADRRLAKFQCECQRQRKGSTWQTDIGTHRYAVNRGDRRELKTL